MKTFGPVPSRRLGRSLGVNNIPAKNCTYSCVYCQLGVGSRLQCERCHFYPPEEIIAEVKDRVFQIRRKGEKIDYITFVPDGEPTLDVNLGAEICALKPSGIKTAVICNSSLVWREDVRTDLSQADLVSLKVDSVHESSWRKINRPHRSLKLDQILEGIRKFSSDYKGKLITETMLVRGINDDERTITEVARFLQLVMPARAYLSVPTRPPAEKWVCPPSEETINRCYQVLSRYLPHVEYLIGYEGDAFANTGNPAEDLLSITSVHPMKKSAVKEFLRASGVDWHVVRCLIEKGDLRKVEYQGDTFYVRNLRPRNQTST